MTDFKPTVPKIVLTGGSLSGKTRLVTELAKRYRDNCIFVPEAATYVIEGGYKFLKENYPPEIWASNMQASILTSQKGVEDSLTEGAPFTKFKSIICDRGLLDGAGYHGERIEEFLRFMEMTIGMNVEQAYARYDKVIMLESIANKGEDFYNTFLQTNPSRIHSWEETLKAENKIKEIWSGHPDFVHIPLQSTYEKLQQVVETELIDYLGTEREFKFLLEKIQDRPLEKIEIEQYYLNDVPEIRIRKVRDTERETVLIGIKKRDQDLELEVEIPYYWYEAMRTSEPLQKARYVDKNGVVFDQFQGFVLAEVEVAGNGITAEWITKWFEAEYGVEVKDVTKDSNYKSHNIWTTQVKA